MAAQLIAEVSAHLLLLLVLPCSLACSRWKVGAARYALNKSNMGAEEENPDLTSPAGASQSPVSLPDGSVPVVPPLIPPPPVAPAFVVPPITPVPTAMPPPPPPALQVLRPP
ncbi:hypothetical protein CRG98_047991, partial [Punica granatum]